MHLERRRRRGSGRRSLLDMEVLDPGATPCHAGSHGQQQGGHKAKGSREKGESEPQPVCDFLGEGKAGRGKPFRAGVVPVRAAGFGLQRWCPAVRYLLPPPPPPGDEEGQGDTASGGLQDRQRRSGPGSLSVRIRGTALRTQRGPWPAPELPGPTNLSGFPSQKGSEDVKPS